MATEQYSTVEEKEVQVSTDSEFIEGQMRRVFRLIYRVVGNVPDAQDLTQEAFVKALSRRSQLKDPRKAAQWLGRIAVNTALDFVRRQKRVTFEELDRGSRDANRKSRAGRLAVGKAPIHRGRSAAVVGPGAGCADPSRCGGAARRRSRPALGMLPGDRTLPYRQRSSEVPQIYEGAKAMSLLFIGHPSEADLALFAGGELGPLARWRIENHLTGCDRCRETVSDFFHLQGEISELNDLPSLDWSALAGRIKLAVADAQSAPRREPRWFPTRPLVVGTGLAMATLLCAFIVIQQFPVSEPAELGEVAKLYEKQDAGAAIAEADAVSADRSAFAPEQFVPREEAVFEATPEGAGAAGLGGEAGSYYENEKKPAPAAPKKVRLALKGKRNELQPTGELVVGRVQRTAQLGDKEARGVGQLAFAHAPSSPKSADKRALEGAERANEPLSQGAAMKAQTESNEGPPAGTLDGGGRTGSPLSG